MSLRGKKIFLISPQHWDSNKISKHHYAETLINNGNIVYFINPIAYGFFPKINIHKQADTLNIVTITIPLPKIAKFKFRFAFDHMVNKGFKKLLFLEGVPDILWNFDNETYFSYESLFKKSIKIFHPVDMIVKKVNKKYNHLYDFVFSVSHEILDTIEHNQKYFINHGLSVQFETFCKDSAVKNEDYLCKNITYMGNISIPFLNRSAFIKMIQYFSHIKFKLIGVIDLNCEFQTQLKMFNNVEFLGRKSGTELFESLLQSDFMLICYSKHELYRADNSHKVLEYLSTGNPIISSMLSTYKDYGDLISFVDFDSSEFLTQVEQILNNYHILNQSENREKRRQLALNNTYQNQLKKIEKIIQNK